MSVFLYIQLYSQQKATA